LLSECAPTGRKDQQLMFWWLGSWFDLRHPCRFTITTNSLSWPHLFNKAQRFYNEFDVFHSLMVTVEADDIKGYLH